MSKCTGVLLEDGHYLQGGDVFCNPFVCILIYRKDTSVAEFHRDETPSLTEKFGYVVLNSENSNVFHHSGRTSISCVSEKGIEAESRFMGNISSTFEVLKEMQKEI